MVKPGVVTSKKAPLATEMVGELGIVAPLPRTSVPPEMVVMFPPTVVPT